MSDQQIEQIIDEELDIKTGEVSQLTNLKMS